MSDPQSPLMYQEMLRRHPDGTYVMPHPDIPHEPEPTTETYIIGPNIRVQVDPKQAKALRDYIPNAERVDR